MEFLKSRWLNKSWVAEQLWGENNRTNTSKLSKKIHGKSNSFNDFEQKKLEEIKKNIEKDLHDT
jgi:hypothetical protein